MKNQLYCFILGFSLFTIHSSLLRAQTTLSLKRKVYNLQYFDLHMDKEIKRMSDSMHFSNATTYLNAADYTDGKTKFTIAVSATKEKGSDAVTADGLYIAPYEADTVYTGYGVSSTEISDPQKPVIICMGKNEYSARILSGGSMVNISKLSGPYVKPDLEMMADTLPDVSFKLVGSNTPTPLRTFLHKGTYVYIDFWATWCSGCYQAMDDLKQLNANFNDKVTVISLDYCGAGMHFDDTNEVKKVIENHNLNWLQGYSSEELEWKLCKNYGIPDGMLFDQNGKVVKREISPYLMLKFMNDKYGAR